MSSNPYNRFHQIDSKEYLSLSNSAIANFKAEQRFDLVTDNADKFASRIEDLSRTYGYNGSIRRVPTDCTIDANDANNITYAEYRDILDTWNEIDEQCIHKVASMVWGAKGWDNEADKVIVEPTAGRGEKNGTNLNVVGKALMLKRFHSNILAAQCWALLSDDAREALKIH